MSAPPPDDDEPVPRLPRGRGMKLDGAMIARIGMTLALLVMIVVTARPCANATSKFVTGFGEEGSASTAMPKPGNVDVLPESNGSAGDYESMGANMTDEERRAAFERAKAKAAARAAERAGAAAGSGSAAVGSGSASGSGGAGSSVAPTATTPKFTGRAGVGARCRRSVSAVGVGARCRRSVSALGVGVRCRRSVSAFGVGARCPSAEETKGRGTRDEGQGTWDEGRGTRDKGRGTRDEGRGTRPRRPVSVLGNGICSAPGVGGHPGSAPSASSDPGARRTRIWGAAPRRTRAPRALRGGGAAPRPDAREPRRAPHRRRSARRRRRDELRSNASSVPALVTALARLGRVGRRPATPEARGRGPPGETEARGLCRKPTRKELDTLVAYTVALDLIRSLRPVVEQLKTYDANTADQVVRAATSITLNIGEGSRRGGKDPKRFYRMAQGSAGEIRAALDTADGWGWKVDTAAARSLLDRELALLYGLCR